MSSNEDYENEIDRMRRNDLAKDALNIGMEDPYWLHNLSVDLRHHEGHEESDLAEQLREDAEALETAHQRLKEGEFTGGEAAVYVARRANFGDYEIASWLNEDMPVTEEP